MLEHEQSIDETMNKKYYLRRCYYTRSGRRIQNPAGLIELVTESGQWIQWVTAADAQALAAAAPDQVEWQIAQDPEDSVRELFSERS